MRRGKRENCVPVVLPKYGKRIPIRVGGGAAGGQLKEERERERETDIWMST